jgi:type II secretion system protein I
LSNLNCKTQGFTLLEIVVALAVMSLCITAVLRSFVGSTGSTRVAGDYFYALQIAETQMALLLTEEDYESTDSGTIGDIYRWESRIEEYVPEDDDPLSARSPFEKLKGTLVPYHYYVQVSWGDSKERNVELSTIHLGAGW